MGIATLNNGGIFDWRIDPKLPDPLERALSGLRRLVAILDVGSRYLLSSGRSATSWRRPTQLPVARSGSVRPDFSRARRSRI